MADGANVDAFKLDVAQVELDDLADRLRRTRWPAPTPAAGWTQGVPVDYLQDLCSYWADRYDWRRCERRLNKAGQFRTRIDGVEIHFLHKRSAHPNAMPLLLTHGWPGSVREFLDVIDALVDPPDPADAFAVIVPSLPGFGFSEAPTEPGWDVQRVAAAWVDLMARLGYDRYGAHGGDWGALITNRIGAIDPAHVAGIHLTIPVLDLSGEPPPAGLSAFEQAGAARLADYQASGTGYLVQQMTRPQTLGYGLADSPAGQLAWILEKFQAWTDCQGSPENAISRDAMLDNVMLYWLTNSAATAARIYWESFPGLPDDVVGVPTGCSIFPFEQIRVPRAVAERKLTDLRHWNEMPAGGHFPGLEQPEALVDELRAFFRPLRIRPGGQP